MNIIQDLIPKGRINRPGTANSCKYITIHDTANKRVGADAASHSKYLKGLKEKTSWHYTVDDECIYQHLPEREKSYHTSDKEANESSIAVELCVNPDGDFVKTVENAVDLIRDLTKKLSIPVENIKRHKDWTGKDCPASFDEVAWNEFLARCTCEEPTPGEKFITLDELRKMGYSGMKFEEGN